jgi:ABC-type antimicrobial peptide transport system permease subunit
MQEWLATGLGALAGAGVGAALLLLALSIPVCAMMALRVLVGREWVPPTYTLRSLRQRKTTTLATVGGLSLVVFVLTAVLMFASGIDNTLAKAGGDLRAKVMRKNLPGEGLSYIVPDQLRLLSTAPDIVKDAAGQPRMSPELVTLIWGSRAGTDDPDAGANLTVRGFSERGVALRPFVDVEGRLFKPGTNELVVGSAIAGRYVGAQVGGTIAIAGQDWQVVGIIDHGGNAYDSEIWGSYDALNAALRRIHSSVTVELSDKASLSRLNTWMGSTKELESLEAVWEKSFWQSRSGDTIDFVMILGLVVAVIFSFGAVLGAMNTMYALVSARTREIGTLRAIGFKPRAILASLVLESVLLAVVAGGLGVAMAALLESVEFRLTTVKTLSEITYGFHLDALTVLSAFGFSVLMGYAGGLLPAWRAARMPVVNALRAD